MKIIHLANHAQSIGNGIVNVMVDLACMQAKAGHEVFVASSGGSFESLLARYGVRHFTLHQSRRPWRLPAMIAGFNHMIERYDPDIVHGHMMTGTLISRFCRVGRRFALITTVHNEFQKSASLMRFGDRVVSVSNAVAASMLRRGVAAERTRVVLNGTIGSPRFVQNSLPGRLSLERPNIVTISGMYERKGIGDLLRAFALVRQALPASLYLVGDGPDLPAMRILARELGVEAHAHFVGFVADPRAYMAEADVFVLASHQESGPLVLSEAREAGRAIVATRVGGMPEMLDGGRAGMLVAPSDPHALANAISRMLTDDEIREGFERRAKENLHVFSVQRVSDEYLDIYAHAIDDLALQRKRPRLRWWTREER